MTEKRIRKLIKNYSSVYYGVLLSESCTISIIEKCRGLNDASVESIIKNEVNKVCDKTDE